MSVKERVEQWFIDWAKRRERRGSFVVSVDIERGEETRVDRLGPSNDDLVADDPKWKPPPGALADEWRPRSTLGPLP